MPPKLVAFLLLVLVLFMPLVTAHAAGLPDLTITSIKFNKDRLIIKVKNQGDAPADVGGAGANLIFGWKDQDGQIIEEREQKVLGAKSGPSRMLTQNAFRRFSYRISPPKGARTLFARIDSGNRIKESNEQNNQLVSKESAVLAATTDNKPDLKIESIEIKQFGQSPQLEGTVVVKNIGSADADLSTGSQVELYWSLIRSLTYAQYDQYGYRIANPFLKKVTLQDYSLDRYLSPEETLIIKEVFTPDTERTFLQDGGFFSAEVDINQKIDELNERNNKSDSTRLAQVPLPNLTIENISFNQDNQSVVTIKNTGDAYADLVKGQFRFGSAYTDLTYGWQDKENRFVSKTTEVSLRNYAEEDVLYPNQTLNITFAISPPSGTTSFWAYVDYIFRLGEQNERDNELAASLPGLRPDLTVTLEPKIADGKWESIRIDVHNTGDTAANLVDASGKRVSVTSGWKDENDNILFSRSTEIDGPNGDFISPGGLTGFWFGFPPPAGATKFFAEVDSTQILAETDEDNNKTELLFEQLEVPDLAVSSVSIDESNAGYSISNVGEKPFNGSVKISYSFLRKNGLWITRDLGEEQLNLNIGSGFGKTFTAQPPADAVSLKVLATTDIAEKTKDNNSAEVLVPFKVPDALNGEKLVKLDSQVVANGIAQGLGEKISQQKGEATPSGLVKTPKGGWTDPLPGDLTYGFKDIGRKVQSVFTFDPQKKADLHNKFATEKILEANTLADQGKFDKAADHLKNYQGDVKAAYEFTNKLVKDKPEVVSDMAKNALEDQIRHQVIVGKIEKEAPLNKLDEVKETREKLLIHIGETIETVGDEGKIQVAIKDGLIEGGSPFGGIWNLEILKSVEKKVPENVKNILEQVKEDETEKLNTSLTQLPEDQQALFVGYTGKAGGSETSYLKVFDDLKFEGLDESVNEELFQAKTAVASDLKNKIDEALKVGDDEAVGVIADLSDGTIEDLRVLNDIEDLVEPEAAQKIAQVKKEAIDQFAESVGGLDESKKTEFVDQTTISYPDIEQVALYQDLEGSLPEDQKEIATKLSESMEEYVEDQLEQNKGNDKAYEKFIDAFGGDDPQDLLVMKSFAGKLGGYYEEDLIDGQLELYDEYFSYFDEDDFSEYYEFYRQGFYEDEVEEVFEEYEPNFYDLIEDYSYSEEEQLEEPVVEEEEPTYTPEDEMYEEPYVED